MAPTADHPIFKTFGYSAATKLLNDGSRLAANGEVMHFETRKHLICIYNNPLLLHLSIDYCGKIPQESMHTCTVCNICYYGCPFIKSPFMSIEMIGDYLNCCQL